MKNALRMRAQDTGTSLLPGVAMDAILLLEDGTCFEGIAFAGGGPVIAEVVFNTSLTGYQEIITDPSYRGQIVVLTASQIGNTGVNDRDNESCMPQIAGLVVRELSPRVSSWRAQGNLADFLAESNIPGLTGVDTRALTRYIRNQGAMKGVIAPADYPRDELETQLAQAPVMTGLDLASVVTCTEKYQWDEGNPLDYNPSGSSTAGMSTLHHVVVLDFGIKRSILRHLVHAGFRVTVVPAQTEAKRILALKPDGIFLSNGPGDPSAVTGAIGTVRELLGVSPIFGICLGHQILALALGGSTYKLKFGHRGGNHPVRHPDGGRVYITAQNHGFAVADVLPAGVKITEINLNDNTIEAIEHEELNAFGVQYHPEAGPGPREASYHFMKFRRMVDAHMSQSKQQSREEVHAATL